MSSSSIVPGKRIGDFVLGEPAGVARERLGPHETEDLANGEMVACRTPETSLWIENGVVSQVGIHGESEGRPRTEHGIGLGVQLKDVPFEVCLNVDEICLLFRELPGLTIDIEGDLESVARSQPHLEGTLQINWIGVHNPEYEGEDADEGARIVLVKLT